MQAATAGARNRKREECSAVQYVRSEDEGGAAGHRAEQRAEEALHLSHAQVFDPTRKQKQKGKESVAQ